MISSPGFLRIVAMGPCCDQGPSFVAGHDVRVEVLQANGEWLPVRGLTSCDIRVRPDEFLQATISVEIAGLDAMIAPTGIEYAQLPEAKEQALARERAERAAEDERQRAALQASIHDVVG